VLAPGLNTDFNALLYVGEHLASRGYGVAALDFPATSANRVKATIEGLATIPPPNAWYRQPQDVSRLIDQVEFNPAILWQCQAPGQVVQQSDFSDPRIKAVIAVNPVSTPIFTGESMLKMPPTCHVLPQPARFQAG
jgi:predicted dienelactone hydrolase